MPSRLTALARRRNALRFVRTFRTTLSESTPLAVRIGVHYGPVFCGIVGCDERQEFTILGDTVNVASRLEALTRTLNELVLISHAALLAATGSWREVGVEQLRGRQQAVTIFASGETDR